MMKNRLSPLAVALLGMVVLPMSAQAQDGGKFSWNVTATSDYIVRGVTASDRNPALQAGVKYALDSGLYVGAWGSKVDFNDSTTMEADGTIGWRAPVGEGVVLDVDYTRVQMLNQPKGVDRSFNQLNGRLHFAKYYTAAVTFADNYPGKKANSWYTKMSGSWPLGNGFNANAGLGHTFNGAGMPDWSDFSVGASKSFGMANVALNYVGTTGGADRIFGKRAADNRVVLSFSISQ